MEVKFCSACGSPMSMRSMNEMDRLACTQCDYVHWGNYSIGVGALIIKEGKVLLVRRAQDPGKGNWTNPGGYIEQFEPIEETIVREVLEETGIHAKIKSIVALRDQPRGIHNVYIAFSMEYISGEPIADGFEVDDVGFFSIEETQSMSVANFTKWLLEVAYQGSSDGLTTDTNLQIPGKYNGLFRM